jgi:small subunit ribosomal protein S18
LPRKRWLNKLVTEDENGTPVAAEEETEPEEPATTQTEGERSAEVAARPERRRRRYVSRRKVCFFCVEKVQQIDYKDVDGLRRYLSDRGKIEPRRKTGICARHQRRLTVALKRARHLALVPYTAEHLRTTGPAPSHS